MKINQSSIQTLPLVLDAPLLTEILPLSRAGVYQLLRQKGCPTIRVGKRMIILRDDFFSWLETQTAA